MLGFKLLALRALAAAADTGASSSDPCYADGSNTFTVSLDEAGSWKFLECGDTAMPVLALEKGVTYTFEQRDASVPARKTSARARRESRTPRRRDRDRSKTQVELELSPGLWHGPEPGRRRPADVLRERRAGRQGRLRGRVRRGAGGLAGRVRPGPGRVGRHIGAG